MLLKDKQTDKNKQDALMQQGQGIKVKVTSHH